MPPAGSAASFYAFVTVVATGALLVAQWRGSRAGVWVAKPIAATGFVATAVACGALETTYGRWILLGLLLSWWGDVLLIPRDRPVFFIAGLASFLLGHLAYAVAFFERGISPGAAVLAGLLLVVPAVAVLRWLGPRLPERMRWPVRAYVVAISFMLLLAFATVIEKGRPAILEGAFMFYVSDLAVARESFVSSTFWNRAWGLPLYFGGQLVLAMTVG